MRPIVVASLLFASMLSSAAVAHATVLERTKFQGTQVATSFSGTVALTCADGSAGTATASGFLSGGSTVTRNKGTPRTETNGIFVEVSYSNDCTGVSLSFADGGVAGGLTPPKNKHLKDAALDGTTLVQDFSSGLQLPVTLAIDVEGTGDVNTSSSSSHTKTIQTPDGPITITITHSASSNRSGIATGTVTVDGVVFAPEFFATSMSLNKNSEIVIEKP